jgi:uncharacterized metal-binding protein/predicted Fe-Mo cluster-binding NifX family protein
MRVAAPVFGSRVAPSFMHSNQLILGRLDHGHIVDLAHRDLRGMGEEQRIHFLEKLGVTVLVCGGIENDLLAELRCRGIEVVNNVAGELDEVLNRWSRGELRPGYGISYRPSRPASESPSPPPPAQEQAGSPPEQSSSDSAGEVHSNFDCIACGSRTCLVDGVCGVGAQAPDVEPVAPQLQQLMVAALDIGTEPERVLCRIAELTYLCVEMQYRHVGLAFCADLFAESETVARLLRRFVRVTPVCCRVGGSPENLTEPKSEFRCNPFAMTRVLNQAETELNVAIGLSIGCDVIFARLSHAPVTTLFVKDKLLANNPVSACHSRYVLERILASP